MRKLFRFALAALCLSFISALTPVMAAEPNADWEAQVRKADEVYWHDFNFGTSAALNAHLSADVEFYHDLGGSVIGYDALAKVNAGMDKTKDRARRVLVPGSLRMFPMRRGPDLYGAIVMGDHDFFRTENGQIGKRTLRASFTHLMLVKDGVWKVARIYSYNHQPATEK
ncbi:hypothetical protein [Massilia sp. TS11]|uniref:hypothetical protein n=1 Tax=Massilia sp. TS11 TaxID=2908003 RepID=UPI001EDB932E|nr:hypothetical protein [Massilia sp. TS11]MCG2586307.1 hypothetical protein [Massilia sp. TS11]